MGVHIVPSRPVFNAIRTAIDEAVQGVKAALGDAIDVAKLKTTRKTKPGQSGKNSKTHALCETYQGTVDRLVLDLPQSDPALRGIEESIQAINCTRQTPLEQQIPAHVRGEQL